MIFVSEIRLGWMPSNPHTVFPTRNKCLPLAIYLHTLSGTHVSMVGPSMFDESQSRTCKQHKSFGHRFLNCHRGICKIGGIIYISRSLRFYRELTVSRDAFFAPF